VSFALYIYLHTYVHTLHQYVASDTDFWFDCCRHFENS